jgi:predicted hotdog family 3-hydroxylacyl-ACP dehydratase
MASSEKMIAGKEDITRYIPQGPPMVMIDCLVSAEGKRTVTTLEVREDNIFCSNGILREPGLIENMAQTAAAGVGYIANRENRKPPVGFIGGIKNLVIRELPACGEEIVTETIVTHEILDATLAEARIRIGERIIAEAELKIFLIKENK